MTQPEAVVASALDRHKAGDFDAAADLYARTITLDAEHLGALFNLAALHSSLGDTIEAERRYQQVLEIAPDDTDAMSNYGNLLQNAGRAEEAEEQYERALAIQPRHGAVHANYGTLCASIGRLEDAERHFRRATELQPLESGGFAGLGGVLARLGREDEGKTALLKAVALDPANADALNNLGNVHADAEDYDKSLQCYCDAAAIRPDWAEIQYNLGVLYDKRKKRADAKEALRRAVELKPDYAKALCRLGELEAEDGEIDEAEKHLRAGAKLTELRSDSEFHLGTLYHYRKDYEQAIAHLKRSIELDDSLPEVWNNLGNSYMESGEEAKAEEAFARALELNPRFAHVHNNLGKLFRSRRDIAEAERQYRMCLEIDPESTVAASNLGTLLVERGEYDEARKWFDRVLELEPGYAVYNGLGLLYQSLNDHKQAMQYLEKALELEPESAEVMNNLAISYHSLGRYQDAVQTYNKIFDIKPDQSEVYLNLANMLLSLSHYDEAVVVFRKALQINADNRGVYPYLAHALMHQCSWDNLQRVTQYIIKNTEEELENGWGVCATPFGLLSLPTTVDLRARVTNNVVEKIEDQVRATREANPFAYPQSRGAKLKVGFVSPDLRSHSVALLFNGIVKNYDRARFEFHGYMVAAYDRDDMTEYFRREMDFFTDLATTTLVDAARKINDDGIHVLVDLAGHTRGAWPQLFALHPAAVQASAIGYASTVGGSLMDYLITDETLWPEDEQQYCSEKLMYLPHTSMPGSPRDISEHRFSRTEMGLPEDGIVFVNCNGHYKFDPETYGTWMRILKRVPGSVLWLMSGSKTSRENLLREAENRGVSADRIVFADNLMTPFHLSRLRLADIALDCFYHVGGATTLDALWAGVPVVVAHGDNVSNRTGRNLLEVCEMPELIGPTIRDVEKIAVDLALDPEKLAAVRAKLADKVKTTPLFDIKLFTRHFERALDMMWDNYEAGNAPKTMRVPALNA